MLRGFEILRFFRVAALDFRITFIIYNNRLYPNRILRLCSNPELINDGLGISNTNKKYFRIAEDSYRRVTYLKLNVYKVYISFLLS